MTGLVGEVMAFVKNVEGFFRLGQHSATTHHQVGQHQVLIGHDAVDPMDAFSCLVEIAVLIVRALALGTLRVIRADPGPGYRVDLLRPGIALTIPGPVPKAIQHGLVQCRIRFRAAADRGIVKKRQRLVHAVAFLQSQVEFREAKITPPPLGERKTEIETRAMANIRQILVDDLFLQGDRRGCDHDLFLQLFCNRNGRHGVGDGFAGTGAGFSDADAARRFINLTQRPRNLCNHELLAIPGLVAFLLQQLRISRLDLFLERVTEHILGADQNQTVNR